MIINIDDMTLGQLKQIAAMFTATQERQKTEPHPMIGKYCICRFEAAGVHAGTVIAVDGDEVTLENSRRLWRWKAFGGVALSGLAQTGLKEGKIDTVNPIAQIKGWLELIPATQKTQESIDGYK